MRKVQAAAAVRCPRARSGPSGARARRRQGSCGRLLSFVLEAGGIPAELAGAAGEVLPGGQGPRSCMRPSANGTPARTKGSRWAPFRRRASPLRHLQQREGHHEALRPGARSLSHPLPQPDRRERRLDHHQRAQPVVFQLDVDVNPVNPPVDVVACRQVPVGTPASPCPESTLNTKPA